MIRGGLSSVLLSGGGDGVSYEISMCGAFKYEIHCQIAHSA